MDEFLTIEQERELVKLAQAGDIESRNKVVMNVDRMVWCVAKRYCRRNAELACVLHAEGISKLCEKFHQFDPLQFDTRFTTWAFSWARQAMVRYLHTCHHKGIRIPVHLQGRLDPEEWRTQYVKRAKGVLSSDAIAPGTDDTTIKDWFVDHRERSPDDSSFRHDRIELVQKVLARLQPRYREILMLRTSNTLEEVGVLLGVTRERIRQLEEKAQRMFVEEAERIGSPIVQELESDIRESNRHWSKRFLQKQGNTMSESNGVMTQKETKKSRIERYLRDNGNCKGRQIKDALLSEGYTVYDAEISAAKRVVFGGGPKPHVTKPTTSGSTISHLRDIKRLAVQVGGLDALAEMCELLKELAA